MESNRNYSMAQLSSWTDTMQKEATIASERTSNRNMSTAQLSTWTDAMQKEVSGAKPTAKSSGAAGAKPQQKPAIVEEDDYEEEFEDYDEDFDNSEGIAPPKQSAAPIPAAPLPSLSAKPTAKGISPEIISANNNTTTKSILKGADSKPTPSTTAAGGGGGGVSGVKYDSLSQSLARSIADPRTVRIQRILASGVLNLQLEKFTILSLLPSSKYDHYLSELRKPTSDLKQIGIPMDTETREMEVMTEEITVANKEIQFSYEDDTKFYQLLEKTRDKKMKALTSSSSKKGGKNSVKDSKDSKDSEVTPSEGELNDNGEVVENNNNNSDNTNEMDSNYGNLSYFLGKASNVFETILREQEEKSFDAQGSGAASKSSKSNELILRSDSSMVFDASTPNGIHELIKFRDCCNIRFAESLNFPSYLLLNHPYPEDEEKQETDLKPYKGLLSVWDVQNPSGPLFVLEVHGQPSSACFAKLQNYLVVCGTMDGSLNLWDLRENDSYHRDKDSIDLKIARGIRKPAFTSFNLDLTQDSSAASNGGHYGAVTQIECVDSLFSKNNRGVTTSVAQFVSIDENGDMIFWVTTENSSTSVDSRADLNIRPGSKISLLQTRKLNIFQPNKSLSSESTKGSNNDYFIRKDFTAFASQQPNNVLIAIVPNDLSSLLVSHFDEVKRISRLGQSFKPSKFIRNYVNEVALNDIEPQKYLWRVTAMNVLTISSSPEISSLLIVGREDGSLDLFRFDEMFPILTWSLNSFAKENNSESKKSDSKKPKNAVIYLKWFEDYSILLVITQKGLIFEFDFNRTITQPIRIQSIERTEYLIPNSVTISETRNPNGSDLKIAFISSKRKKEYFHLSLFSSDMFTNNGNSKESKAATKLIEKLNGFSETPK